MKKIKINLEDYNKLCDMAIEKGKPVEETLMDLLEIANKYHIKQTKQSYQNDKKKECAKSTHCKSNTKMKSKEVN